MRISKHDEVSLAFDMRWVDCRLRSPRIRTAREHEDYPLPGIAKTMSRLIICVPVAEPTLVVAGPGTAVPVQHACCWCPGSAISAGSDVPRLMRDPNGEH